MLCDQFKDEDPLLHANTTPVNTPVDVISDPIPSNFLEYFMPGDSDNEEIDDEMMVASKLISPTMELQVEFMVDSRHHSMLDLEDKRMMDTMYYSMVNIEKCSPSESGFTSAMECEHRKMVNGNDETLSHLEGKLSVQPLDGGTQTPTTDTQMTEPRSKATEKQLELGMGKKKMEESQEEKQGPIDEMNRTKLLRAETKATKLMHVIRDLEKVIADKEQECQKAEAELEEVTTKFRDAQHRSLLREAYVEQMHSYNDEMIHDKEMLEAEKKKLEKELKCEIDRQEEKSLQIQIKLGEAIEGVRRMFDDHTEDHEQQVKAANSYEENFADQNDRLFYYQTYIEELEGVARSYQIPDKDAFYEAEVDLLRGRAIDWTGTLRAIDCSPETDRLTVQYTKDNDKMAIENPTSSTSDTQEVMDASWRSDEISDAYVSSDQLATLILTSSIGSYILTDSSLDSELTRADTLTSSVRNFHLTNKEHVNMANSLICLSQEDFEVGADDYLLSDKCSEADGDIDMQALDTDNDDVTMEDIVGERPADKTTRQLLHGWRDTIRLLEHEGPRLVTASQNPRIRPLNWRRKYFDLSLTVPVTSPISVLSDRWFEQLDFHQSSPYLARGPPPPPPSKRICLSRLRFSAWNHPQGQVIFEERLTQRQPHVDVGLGQFDPSPLGLFSVVQAGPDDQATIYRVREKSGWALPIANCLRAMKPKCISKDAGACIEGKLIMYYASFWKALSDWAVGLHKDILAHPKGYVVALVGMGMMGVMMWLAYGLHAYEEWKVANDEPTALETLLERVPKSITEIWLVEKAWFGLTEWLDYERAWIG
jgi:uncharacterized coiled-coil protein SlyX